MELLEYKILLEKFYEGNTSLFEEADLKNFLQNYRGTDSEMIQAKMMFQELSKESKETVDLDFEIISRKNSTLRLKRIYGTISAIAASLIIGISLMFLLKTNNPPVVYAYINGKPITDKALAIQQSKQALSSIKTNLSKGTKGLNYMNEMNKPRELLTVKN